MTLFFHLWFFLWTFHLISHIFHPLSTFDFIYCTTLMILLLLFSFILSVICSFMSFILSIITVFSYMFSVFWYCALSCFVFLIAWYPFLSFSWKFSLLTWCYFILLLTISRGYFRNWGQCLEDIKKDTFSLQRV